MKTNLLFSFIASFQCHILNVGCRRTYVYRTMRIVPSCTYLNKIIASRMSHQFLMLWSHRYYEKNFFSSRFFWDEKILFRRMYLGSQICMCPNFSIFAWLHSINANMYWHGITPLYWTYVLSRRLLEVFSMSIFQSFYSIEKLNLDQDFFSYNSIGYM